MMNEAALILREYAAQKRDWLHGFFVGCMFSTVFVGLGVYLIMK